ncbi:hypothetical protein GCM10023330_30310 [Litoribaculum gwangyangense]|uniref:Uncharacterized protein n=1 Tax=Litoribaculum gwangyangense TaxID=1130722 RepID=A0ABP9D026_9FLAO
MFKTDDLKHNAFVEFYKFFDLKLFNYRIINFNAKKRDEIRNHSKEKSLRYTNSSVKIFKIITTLFKKPTINAH